VLVAGPPTYDTCRLSGGNAFQVGLREEGFDLTKVKDPIYWLNPATRQYEQFDSAAHATLLAGKAKL